MFKKIQNLTRITDTLHEDLHIIITITISKLVLLRRKNVSDKRCRENQNTHFMFDDIFPKIAPLMG